MILTENGVLKLMQRIKSFITSQLNTKANSVHTHSISEIDDLSTLSMGGGVYSKSEVDTLLTGKADTSHTHTKSQIADFPTIPSKTSDLTNDLGFISSEIDSMGEGWVRFKCGLQICWGTIILRSACSLTWGVLYDTSNMSGSYAKSFVEIPSVSACGSIGNSAGAYASMLECNVATGSTTSTPMFNLCRPAAVNEVLNCAVRYTAIGRWK